MNTARNPITGECEPCLRREGAIFEGDRVIYRGMIGYVDTVDVDGDDSRCRLRLKEGLSQTTIVDVDLVRKVGA